MPKLRVLSGSDVISILGLFGFEINSQKGSHIKLIRFNNSIKQTLTIPNHKSLDRGTLKSIIRQLSNYLTADEYYQYFYHD